MCGSSGHESCESQFDQLPLHEWESSRSGGDYDIGSVMHYGTYFNMEPPGVKWKYEFYFKFENFNFEIKVTTKM